MLVTVVLHLHGRVVSVVEILIALPRAQLLHQLMNVSQHCLIGTSVARVELYSVEGGGGCCV